MVTEIEKLQEEIRKNGWTPSLEDKANSNLGRLMKELGFDYGDYMGCHRWSTDNREIYWGLITEKVGIEFETRPHRVLVDSGDVEKVKWFPGAKMNIVESCFKADPKKTAIYYGKGGCSEIQEVTYGELEKLVNMVANGVKKNFEIGDAIAMYMPMSYEAFAAYMGIVKAGCVVVSIADSFAAPEIKKRMEIADAKGIITTNYFRYGGKNIELLKEVKKISAPKTIVVPLADEKAKLRKKDLFWSDFLGDDKFESVIRDASDYTNILFSSGTTGSPKAIPWTHINPIKAITDFYLYQDTKEYSINTWTTGTGWVMGPILMYGSLANNATMAIYNGAYTNKEFGKFVQDVKVSMLGVIPRFVKYIHETRCMENFDWSNIKLFSNTGERSNKRDFTYLMALPGIITAIIEYMGGTEIGGHYLGNTLVQKMRPTIFTAPALGLDIVLLNEYNKLVKEEEKGEIYLVSPWPGESQNLLNRDKDHHEIYYKNTPKGPNGGKLRRHGDCATYLGNGNYKYSSRSDDDMNLGGIKVGSGDIEEILTENKYISESAAISFSHDDQPEVLIIYAVLKKDVDNDILFKSVKKDIRKAYNPLFASVLEAVIPIDELPRNAGNKIVRSELRNNYLKNRDT